MAGRTGMDQLCIALIILALILNIFSRLFSFAVLSLLALAVLIAALVRFFSKRTAKRIEENRHFTDLWYRIKGSFSAWFDRLRQSRDYKFFTCPGCRNRLRVPRGKGRIQITCPKCGQRFDGRS